MSESNVHAIREFRLAAQYRRCGWYCFLGAIAFTGTLHWLRIHQLIPNRQDVGPLIASGLWIGAAVLLLVSLYRWRLRVDEQGVSRRRIWKWDLWSWEEFESGDIEQHGSNFTSRVRPFWRNALLLEFLERSDCDYVKGVCKLFHEPPPEFADSQPIPDELTVHYQLVRRAAFRRDGVRVRVGKKDRKLGWDEVEEIRLWHPEHGSMLVHALEVVLADRKLTIVGIRKVVSPEGATRNKSPKTVPIVVVRYLRANVPAGKLRQFALRGAPASWAEHDCRLLDLDTRRRNVRMMQRVLPPLTGLLSGAVFLPRVVQMWRVPGFFPHVGWLILATVLVLLNLFMPVVLVLAAIHMHCRHVREGDAELTAWRQQQPA